MSSQTTTIVPALAGFYCANVNQDGSLGKIPIIAWIVSSTGALCPVTAEPGANQSTIVYPDGRVADIVQNTIYNSIEDWSANNPVAAVPASTLLAQISVTPLNTAQPVIK